MNIIKNVAGVALWLVVGLPVCSVFLWCVLFFGCLSFVFKWICQPLMWVVDSLLSSQFMDVLHHVTKGVEK